jgi:hypothetical protein
MRPISIVSVAALLALPLCALGCAEEPALEDTESGTSDLAQAPSAAQLYYWDASGRRHPLAEIIHTDNLYACLEDACIGEGYLAWMAAAWVVSVGSAWFVTNDQQRVGPFPTQAAAQNAVSTAARTAKKKKRDYLCTTTCQSNGSDRGAYYVSGTSATDCASATLDAKAKIPRGEYPRHCSCVDTDNFRGTGTQCENHVRR